MDFWEIVGDKVVPVRGEDRSDAIDVSFFVPCYNEAENIVGAIANIVDVATLLGPPSTAAWRATLSKARFTARDVTTA
jgi:hypothetical protein